MSLTHPNGTGSLPLQTIYLEMLCEEKECLAHGTGFFVKCAVRQFGLITALHNVSALDIFTQMPVTSAPAPPRYLRVWLHSWTEQRWIAGDIDLIDKPWIDASRIGHPETVSDIAMLLFEPFQTGICLDRLLIEFQMINEERAFRDWQEWRVGLPMSVLGFPVRRADQKSAIAVAGQLASEPRTDFEHLGVKYPFFIVSARTWAGMSGGPVVPGQGHGGYAYFDGNWSGASGGPPLAAGLYGGRLPVSSRESSDLGMVWRIEWFVAAVRKQIAVSDSKLPMINLSQVLAK